MLQSSFSTFDAKDTASSDAKDTASSKEEPMSLILSCSRLDIPQMNIDTEGPELVVPVGETDIPDKVAYQDDQPDSVEASLASAEAVLYEEANQEPEESQVQTTSSTADPLLGFQAQHHESTPDSLIGHL